MFKSVQKWTLGDITIGKSLHLLVVALILLFACLMILPHLNLDRYIEHLFFNPATNEWLIEKENAPLRAIFYYGAKYSIAAYGVTLIAMLIRDHYTGTKSLDRRAVLFVVVCLIIIPSTMAFLKYLTGMPCPYQLQEYGGVFSYTNFLNFHWPDGTDRPSCFPAGHPSGGFALLALAFVSKQKKKVIAIAIIFGFFMSFYQMARGAHFLSHCLITLFFSLALINIIYIKFLSLTSVSKAIIPINKKTQLNQEIYGQDQRI